MNRRKANDQMDMALDVQWVEAVPATDDETLAAAARTQPEALAELFDRYYDRVYRYVYHRVRNQWEAEDIASLVFVRVAESLPRFRAERGTFVPWLFRIAHNAVIDSYRRRRFTAEVACLDDTIGDDSTERHIRRAVERESMDARLAQLSDDQRDAIVLRFMSDLSYTEIAATLDKSEAAVRMVIHRALKRLREVYEEETDDG